LEDAIAIQRTGSIEARGCDYSLQLHHGSAGRFREAASNYREAISLNPSFAYAHYNLGMALRLNDPGSAQAEFADAHCLDPALNAPVTAK
jgi:Flp pilus assembly protein TadD